MNTVDDLAWKVIRSCGLSTGNSDINVIALHKDIREMLKPRELTDEEITEEIEKMFGKIIDPEVLEDELTLARAILKKANEK
ncbi:MAG: hypothetical protein HQ449_05615 [Chitinophagaceae bacterium]|nr:hypothetical protein [Chitinophagaceae bacterium]